MTEKDKDAPGISDAADVTDEELDGVAGGGADGAGGASMEISSPGSAPGTAAVNYPD